MSEPSATTAADPTAGQAAASKASRGQPWIVGLVAILTLVALFWPRSDERINFQASFRKSRGGQAPPGMLVDSGGRPTPLASRTAPVTLVHFWSTWCPPCITEIPSILRMADAFAQDHHFSLVMIAVQDDVDKAQTFLGKRVTEALFDHDWKVAHSFGTEKLPETHLVVQGKLVESFIGATDWDDPDNRSTIQKALASVEENEG
jgi:cytochrome c biogenesis protein CcmG, thiol:disulfide interchange protein DsbE